MGKNHVRKKIITKERTRFASHCHFSTYLLAFHTTGQWLCNGGGFCDKSVILASFSGHGHNLPRGDHLRKKLTHNHCVWTKDASLRRKFQPNLRFRVCRSLTDFYRQELCLNPLRTSGDVARSPGRQVVAIWSPGRQAAAIWSPYRQRFAKG